MRTAPPQQFQIEPELEPDTWHERHRVLLQHFRQISPPGLLPGRQHLDPASIPKLLPYVILYDVVREGEIRLRFRLVGTAIRQWIGSELTGRYTDEVSDVSVLMDVLRPAIEDGRAVWRRWPRLVQTSDSYSFMEALLLPLAEDGRHVEMLLGLYQAYDIDGRPLDF